MKVLVYSAKSFEIPYLKRSNHTHLDVSFTELPLSLKSVNLSKGYDCISVFTADDASRDVLEQLHFNGVAYVAVRAAGYDNIDLTTANELGIHVANVPEYSPYSIAEHTAAMVLALNRKLILSDRQVHEKNFTLDNLIGFDLHDKTVGIIGTGRIGKISARIMHGFGCHLLGYDIEQSSVLKEKYNLRYCSLQELCLTADIILIHTPLNAQTKYLINKELFSIMKRGVMIVNTARGPVVNTADLLIFLQNGIIGAYGMDVYEKEKGIFFFNHSGKDLQDPILVKLLDMKNVLVTPHQAFATYEALSNLSDTTFLNILQWKEGLRPESELTFFPKAIASFSK
jgi:D-lactate dehydrogenase